MTMDANKKDDLTIVLFYDENANKFHNESLCGGGTGAAAIGSRLNLKADCLEEESLGSVSLENVKYKLQVNKESLPIASKVDMTSSGLLVTTSGELIEVDDYNKFKDMVIERCKQKVRNRIEKLPQQQQLEQLGKGLLNGIEELDLKVVQREQQAQTIFPSKAQVAEVALDDEAKMKERMKRKVRKEWKNVSKRILLSRIEKYYK